MNLHVHAVWIMPSVLLGGLLELLVSTWRRASGRRRVLTVALTAALSLGTLATLAWMLWQPESQVLFGSWRFVGPAVVTVTSFLAVWGIGSALRTRGRNQGGKQAETTEKH